MNARREAKYQVRDINFGKTTFYRGTALFALLSIGSCASLILYWKLTGPPKAIYVTKWLRNLWYSVDDNERMKKQTAIAKGLIPSPRLDLLILTDEEDHVMEKLTEE